MAHRPDLAVLDLEIAAAVHLAPGTVRNYLSAAMTKRHAAAHTAWEQRWI